MELSCPLAPRKSFDILALYKSDYYYYYYYYVHMLSDIDGHAITEAIPTKFPKMGITGCRWTTIQNLTPIALSSPEKSVTVQTNKITNSKQYIHTLPIGLCE